MAMLGAKMTRIAVDAAASGANTLIAAGGAGNKFRIWKIHLNAAGTVTVRFRDGTTDLEGDSGRTMIAGVPLVMEAFRDFHNEPVPLFGDELTANTLFDMTLGGAVQVSGSVWYTIGNAN